MAWKRGIDRTIAATTAVLVILLGSTLLFLDWQAIHGEVLKQRLNYA